MISKKHTLPLIISALLILGGCSVPQPQTSTSEPTEAPSEKDPSKNTVLIGSKIVDNMRLKVEFEPSKGMYMNMNDKWMTMNPAEDDLYHLEVKLEDPYSNTRIPNSSVKLFVTKESTEETISYDLHPMWGGSGLHYADNGKLMGDGNYNLTVLANAPTFVRGDSNKDLWLEAISADFKFSIENGIITSEADVNEPDVPALAQGEEKKFHVVVGDAVFEDMGVKVEFEDSANMYMLMNEKWTKMEPKDGDIHFEVKLNDNLQSNTRIPYSEVTLTATNKQTGEEIKKSLHPMWGGSGLHYGANSQLPLGEYSIIINIGVPTFARGLTDKDFYMNPIEAKFDYTHELS